MRKRNDEGSFQRLAVDVDTLAIMCGIGVTMARKIGEDSGAVIQLGKRKVYNVKKVQHYLDSISGE